MLCFIKRYRKARDMFGGGEVWCGGRGYLCGSMLRYLLCPRYQPYGLCSIEQSLSRAWGGGVEGAETEKGREGGRGKPRTHGERRGRELRRG